MHVIDMAIAIISAGIVLILSLWISLDESLPVLLPPSVVLAVSSNHCTVTLLESQQEEERKVGAWSPSLFLFFRVRVT